LLAKEKQLTRLRDALNTKRRRLPMVRIEEDYVFEGPNGSARPLDLFEGRLQLVIYHFKWLWNDGEPLETGCRSCSGWANQVSNGHLTNMHVRGTSFALVSRGGGQYFLDLTALGRQEEWELPKGRITELGARAGSEKILYPDEYKE
jgi:predicted dithiol-disulfide oxidoreductase (DUF899 family)